MTSWRLRISEADYSALEEYVLQAMPKEAAAFGLIGLSSHDDCTDILVRRVLKVPQDDFRRQLEYHLEISPRAINGLISLCESNKLGGLVCHSHGWASDYSPTDDDGESRIFETLKAFVPSGVPLASLLFYPGGVRGRVWIDGEPVILDEVIVVGRAVRRLAQRPDRVSLTDPDGAAHDRQVRAFGADGQALIERAKVGVVGLGGTGTPTAEQLARLGVRDLLTLDDDYVDPTSRSRMYGSLPEHDGRAKVEVITEHLRRIAPGINVRGVKGNVVEYGEMLLDRDVLFLCTDDHWGRSVVNQIAYQFLIPTINMGIRITSDEGVISHGVGVVDVLRPGNPCLWCKQYLRAERIAAESMPADERARLAQEGYVEGLEIPAPSVVSATTTISGMGVSLFLQLLTDFMGKDGAIARLNYNLLDGTVRRGTGQVLPQCICQKIRGTGSLRPLPTLKLG